MPSFRGNVRLHFHTCWCAWCFSLLQHSGGSRGANPAMTPIEVGYVVCPPRGRMSNDSIVNLPKSNDFGPPYRCRLWIWPPYGKIPQENIKKGRWL